MVRAQLKPIVIVGPTGSGKTQLAFALAEAMQKYQFACEVISCDSVQVYRDFNIGSAKPSKIEQEKLPHHLVDVAFYYEDFDAGLYAKLARQKWLELQSKKIVPLIVGGTGLYLRALLGLQFHSNLPKDPDIRAQLNSLPTQQLYQNLLNLDPARARQIHPHDRLRIVRALEIIQITGQPVSKIIQENQRPLDDQLPIIYLNPPREQLRHQLSLRTQNMLRNGLLEETQRLLDTYEDIAYSKPMQSIGYAQCCAYLKRILNKNELHTKIYIASCQYAKRQRTWFNKMPWTQMIDEPSHIHDCVKTCIKSWLHDHDD